MNARGRFSRHSHAAVIGNAARNRRVSLTFAGGFFLAMISAFASVAQTQIAAPLLTEPEKAAVAQRPLTSDERTRLTTACRLPLNGGEKLDLGAGVTFGRLHLVPQTALALIDYKRAPNDSRQFEIASFPPLPNGGIGGRDFCGMVTLLPSPESARTTIMLLALRLRPELNGAADYPTAWQAARKNGQFVHYPEGDFAIVRVTDAKRAFSLVATVLRDPRVDPRLPAMFFDEVLLIPLKPQ